MTTKKELLNTAKQNGFVYPRLKVIFYFGFVNGLFGIIVGLMNMLIFGLIPSIIFDDMNMLAGIDFINDMIEANFFIELLNLTKLFFFIPAFLTGIYCAIFKIIIIKNLDYLPLFIIGTVISAICLNFWMVDSSNELSKILVESFIFGSINGISAIICGKLFLPKFPEVHQSTTKKRQSI